MIRFRNEIDENNVLRVYANGELLFEEKLTEKEASRFAESCFKYNRKMHEHVSELSYNPVATVNSRLQEAPRKKNKSNNVETDNEDNLDSNSDMDLESEDFDGEEFDDADALDLKPDQVPEEFDFNSRIVFISNLNYIPEALADRCTTIEMNFTKKQILDYIKSQLDKVIQKIPNATLEDAIEVWDFINKYVHVARKISFRNFQMILALKLEAPEKWMQYGYIMLSSGMAPGGKK